jgi:hypothetical protein
MMSRTMLLVLAALVVAGVNGSSHEGTVAPDRSLRERARPGHSSGQVIRGAVIAGRLTDAYGRATVYGSLSLRERRQTRSTSVWTNVLGRYRASGLAAGDYIVSAQSYAEPIRLGSTEGSFLRPAIVYYPDAPDPLLAKPVTVADGEERLGIDLVLRLVAVR